ncbi:hypothetical protein HCN56_12465, partial [Streptomyces lonarensis]|nr:hypothetical protein [Streptomyces lonarensis]
MHAPAPTDPPTPAPTPTDGDGEHTLTLTDPATEQVITTLPGTGVVARHQVGAGGEAAVGEVAV